MKIVIFGSSGHGSDIADIAIDNGYTDIVFLTKEVGLDFYCGYPVKMDTEEIVEKLAEQGYHFAIGIGESRIRRLIFERYPDLIYPTLIHSSATIGNCLPANLKAVKGTVLAAGSRITNNVSIGDFSFLGVNSVVGHDCIIEAYVSLMPGAAVSGNVTICEGSYIGCNAAIRQGTPTQKMLIGKNVTIGMGAVVLQDVPEDHIASGVPAISYHKPII